MAEIIVVNVVASASIGKELMLQDIAFQLEGAEYDQDRFPGLIYKLAEPKTAVLIFRSGKVVCTGARSIPDVHVAINKVVDELRVLDMPVKDEPDIVIQNIVATTNLESTLNLIQIAMSLGFENVEYEPEAFPGLVYRMDDPKVVLLLFGAKKLPELARGLGLGLKEFKKATREIKDEVQDATDKVNEESDNSKS